MRSRLAASDNLDGTRQDAQANLNNPVHESLLEEQTRSTACQQRKESGDIFLLLHLLAPWVKVDDVMRNFQDFYLYAGFDCTNKFANFLGDEPRKETMAARLQEAFWRHGRRDPVLSGKSCHEAMESGTSNEDA